MIQEKCAHTFILTRMLRQPFDIRVARKISRKFDVFLKTFPDFYIPVLQCSQSSKPYQGHSQFTDKHTQWAFSNYQLNAQFLYSSTICMLNDDPQHVSSSTLLILRRTNCITTASGIVTLCKQPYSMQVESGLSPLSTCILYGCLQTVTIPEAVVIQFVLLRMSSVLLETC